MRSTQKPQLERTIVERKIREALEIKKAKYNKKDEGSKHR